MKGAKRFEVFALGERLGDGVGVPSLSFFIVPAKAGISF